MHRLSRWAGTAVLVLTLGSAPTVIADDESSPCGVLPPLAASYPYLPGEPVVLIGTGAATTILDVERLPTDRYGVVTVASDSEGPFAFTITPPEGAMRPVFATDSPDALTGALLLDRVGEYTITVEATGAWAIVIR